MDFRILDTTLRQKMLSFMEIYSSYNQIRMHPDNAADETHTSFYTDRDKLCCKVIPFDLVNADQSMINKLFKNTLEQNMEAFRYLNTTCPKDA